MLKRLTISKKLYFEFIILFLLFSSAIYFVISQENYMVEITNKLYEHPFKVLQASGDINSDILSIDIEQDNLIGLKDVNKLQERIDVLDRYTDDISKKIDILSAQFLGSIELIIKIKEINVQWNAANLEFLRLIRSGQFIEAQRIKNTKEHILRKIFSDTIQDVRSFAKGKAKEFQLQSIAVKSRTHRLLYSMLFVYLVSVIIFAIYIIRSITTPLYFLKKTVNGFADDLPENKTNIYSDDEIGSLANSFTHMTEKVKAKTFEIMESNKKLLFEIQQKEHEVNIRKAAEEQIIR
ncbi:MAG: hypothetical protein HQK93_07680 [Nitrospirae bacterium]|nr:hypothetical protein [Nitrospirota bacterium]